ncbi:hypothetical protein [Shewanella sp. Isolate7]|nr:hypothetical protein [Shewanella sp. Isolate7]MCG9720963.1 hypothetical protein [Shewanella sp. Isolate7]
MGMTEEMLVQEVTADYLLNELYWDESVYGMYGKLGKEGDLVEKSGQS